METDRDLCHEVPAFAGTTGVASAIGFPYQPARYERDLSLLPATERHPSRLTVASLRPSFRV